ncbi:MAG: hypothetical protein ACPIOQ_26300, partial [Promethearchaeia archaeon]
SSGLEGDGAGKALDAHTQKQKQTKRELENENELAFLLLQFRDDKVFGFLKCVPSQLLPLVCFFFGSSGESPTNTPGLAGALVSGAT